MSDELRNWNNWRYLPLGTKERQAWHYMLRLEIQNKKLTSRIEESCKVVEGLFGGAAADEFNKAMK